MVLLKNFGIEKKLYKRWSSGILDEIQFYTATIGLQKLDAKPDSRMMSIRLINPPLLS